MEAITAVANAQLVEVGPSDLSVRAVARELGMASSAIYRYVSSRDELLTLLIVSGFNDMAGHVETAAGKVADPRKRWRVIGMACRDWAIEQPQRFALIYGSPVVGYAAPEDTIGPATRRRRERNRTCPHSRDGWRVACVRCSQGFRTGPV